MRIAVHQMCSGIDPDANANIMCKAVADAGREGACIYFAPEMSVLLDRDRTRAAGHIGTEEASRWLRDICIAAQEARIWVHLGSMAVRSETDNNLLANRSLVIGPDGLVKARYDKMHLFDVELATGEKWQESAAYVPGCNAVAVDTPLGLLGLTICYDLRFPDLYSTLSHAKADVIAVPAAFTVTTGQAHWHTLLRARAIEAEAFIVAAAQSGSHEDGRQTYGHSLVVDPWGEVLLDMGEGEGLDFVDIDLTRIAEVRAQIPVHANRRAVPTEITRY